MRRIRHGWKSLYSKRRLYISLALWLLSYVLLICLIFNFTSLQHRVTKIEHAVKIEHQTKTVRVPEFFIYYYRVSGHHHSIGVFTVHHPVAGAIPLAHSVIGGRSLASSSQHRSHSPSPHRSHSGGSPTPPTPTPTPTPTPSHHGHGHPGSSHGGATGVTIYIPSKTLGPVHTKPIKLHIPLPFKFSKKLP